MAPHLNKLDISSPSDALCQKNFCFYWPSGSRQELFFNVVNEFLPFRYYLPVEKDMNFHLNKLESHEKSHANLVAIGPVILERMGM